MKLLVLTSRFPYPIERGDKLRAYHQIRELSRRHEIVLVALNDKAVSEQDMAEMEKYCKQVYVFPLNLLGIAWRIAKAYFTGQPMQQAYFNDPGLIEEVQALIQQEAPDQIYCQLLRVAEFVRHAPQPKVLDYMDALSMGMRRRAERSPGWLKAVFYREARLLTAYEAQLLPDFDHCTIISAQDREYIRHSEANTIQVIPNGVDVSFFYPQADSIQPYELVFVGNMGYFPNVKAAHYLVKEVLPLLDERVNVLLAGARPSATVKALVSKRVKLTGWVEDIRQAYGQGRIFVAPLFAGSGQQNKILEAMAMGIPCITTPMVNRAIGAEAGNEILLAVNAEDFAEKIQFLQRYPQQARAIAKAGRRFVERTFSWESSVEKLESLFSDKLKK